MNYLRFKQILQSRTSHVQDNEKRLIEREREREREVILCEAITL